MEGTEGSIEFYVETNYGNRLFTKTDRHKYKTVEKSSVDEGLSHMKVY